jgi:ferric-dicitrate binding protein FerR (iron transport regulator)
MDQDNNYILLTKFLSGEATPEELEQLEWAFLANPELRKMAELLPEFRLSPPKGVSTQEEEAMLQRGLQQFARLKEKADPVEANQPVEHANPAPLAPLRRLMNRWTMAAASILVLFMGGVYYFRSSKHAVANRHSPVMIAAARGTRRYMKLPDGSQVWLNAGSRIILSDGFVAGKRELTLEGEAYLDVKHDEMRPFIVHSGKVEVRVLGTALNIRAYPGDSTVETTLIDGKVEIGMTGDPGSAVFLHPNEKLIISTGLAEASSLKRADGPTKQLPVAPLAGFVRRPVVPDRTDGTITETSWVENKLVFRQQTIAALAGQLERWYNVKILFTSKRYQQDTISGTFPNVPINDVMDALKITTGLHYRLDRDTVRIW